MSNLDLDSNDNATGLVDSTSRKNRLFLVAAVLTAALLVFQFLVRGAPVGGSWFYILVIPGVLLLGSLERNFLRSRARVSLESGIVEVRGLNQHYSFRQSDLKVLKSLTFITPTRSSNGLSYRPVVVFVSHENKSLAVSYVQDFGSLAYFAELADKLGVSLEQFEGEALGKRELNELIPFAGDQGATPLIKMGTPMVIGAVAMGFLLIVGMLTFVAI